MLSFRKCLSFVCVTYRLDNCDASVILPGIEFSCHPLAGGYKNKYLVLQIRVTDSKTLRNSSELGPAVLMKGFGTSSSFLFHFHCLLNMLLPGSVKEFYWGVFVPKAGWEGQLKNFKLQFR